MFSKTLRLSCHGDDGDHVIAQARLASRRQPSRSTATVPDAGPPALLEVAPLSGRDLIEELAGPVAPGHPGIAERRRARAYVGEAHGRTWLIFGEGPPATVELLTGPRRTTYRLLCRARTGRPVRDSQGNYVYVRDLSADERAEAAAAQVDLARGISGSPP